MKHHNHHQHPFSDELRQRRERRERMERRAQAGYDFIRTLIIASLACWALLALMAVLDGGLA